MRSVAAVMKAGIPDPLAQIRDPQEAGELNGKVVELLRQGKYTEALPLAQRALELRTRALGAHHELVGISANNLAEVLNLLGRSDEALPYYAQALAIKEGIFGTRSPRLTTTLGNLAGCLANLGKYDEAQSAYERALEIRGGVTGPPVVELASILNDLAVLHLRRSQAAAARPLLERALDIRRRLLGDNDPDTAQTLNNLGATCELLGELDEARRDYERALAARKQALGDEHPGVGESLTCLAGVQTSLGDYEGAESNYRQALEIDRHAFGRNHPRVAGLLSNLGDLYVIRGEYASAESVFAEALAISESVLGKDHPDTANPLNNLAMALFRQGAVEEAKTAYLRVLAIRERAYGEDSLPVASTLASLADVLKKLNDFEGAAQAALRAHTIRERLLGPDNIQMANSHLSVGSIDLLHKDYDAARTHYESALAIRERHLGKDHVDVAAALNGLALVNVYLRRMDAAESLYLRAEAIYERKFGADNVYVVEVLQNLVSLYIAVGKTDKAIDALDRAGAASERILVDSLAVGTERRKQALLAVTGFDVDTAISLHLGSAPLDRRALRIAFETILRRKGRVLDVLSRSVELCRRLAPSEGAGLLRDLLEARRNFAECALRGGVGAVGTARAAELEAIGARLDSVETSIVRLSSRFPNTAEPVTLEAVGREVPGDCALVEYSIYRRYDPGAHTYGAPRYVAYVLPGAGTPQAVELANADSVATAVRDLRAVVQQRPKDQELVKAKARALDRLVMEPVRSLLGERRKLLVAPDGLLNLVPFAMLVDENGKFLLEKYEISYLTSGRDLLRMRSEEAPRSACVVIADPNFDRGVRAATAPGPRLGPVEFEPLVGLSAAGTEASMIARLFEGSAIYRGDDADKARLEDVAGPSILHVATHGYFIDAERPGGGEFLGARLAVRRGSDSAPPQPEVENRATNPLLWSGLFLAGANSGSAAGVITALEVSALDLRGTQLVVLSACDTGIGEVRSGDGVYGLRRALVLAGSQSQIMSLWPVSDSRTRDLMEAFYLGLKVGKARSSALRDAQLGMLHDKTANDPFFWAGFILSGRRTPLE